MKNTSFEFQTSKFEAADRYAPPGISINKANDNVSSKINNCLRSLCRDRTIG